jgi:hypothetical protein
MARCDANKDVDPVYQAGHDYYKYIHDWDYMTKLTVQESFTGLITTVLSQL